MRYRPGCAKRAISVYGDHNNFKVITDKATARQRVYVRETIGVRNNWCQFRFRPEKQLVSVQISPRK